MNRVRRHPFVSMLIAAVLILGFVIAGYGIFLANEAGRLPWQEEPTRIAITPFADIPGFNQPMGTPPGT